MPELPLSERYHNFKEVETGFTARLAIEEAKRCLHCYRQEIGKGDQDGSG